MNKFTFTGSRTWTYLVGTTVQSTTTLPSYYSFERDRIVWKKDLGFETDGLGF